MTLPRPNFVLVFTGWLGLIVCTLACMFILMLGTFVWLLQVAYCAIWPALWLVTEISNKTGFTKWAEKQLEQAKLQPPQPPDKSQVGTKKGQINPDYANPCKTEEVPVEKLPFNPENN